MYCIKLWNRLKFTLADPNNFWFMKYSHLKLVLIFIHFDPDSISHKYIICQGYICVMPVLHIGY